MRFAFPLNEYLEIPLTTLDFWIKKKIGLIPDAKIYKACALIHNAQTCLYWNNTSYDLNCEHHLLKIILSMRTTCYCKHLLMIINNKS